MKKISRRNELGLPTGLESDICDAYAYDEQIAKNKDAHNSIHLGQRKLFNAMLNFLTKYVTKKSVVVYAGAAPGHNILYINEFFPGLTWELYDPAFVEANTFQGHSNIHVNPERMTEHTVDRLKELYDTRDILFFSDIRSTRERRVREDLVAEDMTLQRTIVGRLEPKAFCLKFRIPYLMHGKRLEQYNYLDGELWLQPYNRTMSAEARLIGTDSKSVKQYDHTHERRMFYVNMVLREFGFYADSATKGVDGGNHDFDSALETRYLINYLLAKRSAAKFNTADECRQYLNELQPLKYKISIITRKTADATTSELFAMTQKLPLSESRLADPSKLPDRDVSRIPSLLYKRDPAHGVLEILKKFDATLGMTDKTVLEVLHRPAENRLLMACITHPSIDLDTNYENAEFLGDSALNFLIKEYVSSNYRQGRLQQRQEAIWSKISSHLHSGNTLTKFFARKLGTERLLRIHDELPKEKALEDCTEALFLFFLRGFQCKIGRSNYIIAQTIVQNLLDPINLLTAFGSDIYPPTSELKEVFEAQKKAFKDNNWDYGKGFRTEFVVAKNTREDMRGEDEWRENAYDVTLRAPNFEPITFRQYGTKKFVQRNAARVFLIFLKNRGFEVANPLETAVRDPGSNWLLANLSEPEL